MMEHLGIDPSGGVVPGLSMLYATALRRCKPCASTRACRDWLDSTPGSASFAPPFCPIGDILSELQFRQLKRTVSVAGGQGAMRRIPMWQGNRSPGE